MKELLRIKNSGASYEELKTASINGTGEIKWNEKKALITSPSSSNSGYKKFVGKKGNLDQRLRAVIAYKRSNFAVEDISKPSELTVEEENELENLMENDEFDEEIDDEEKQFESLVLQAIENNKLAELKKNLALTNNIFDFSNSTSSSLIEFSDKDLEKVANYSSTATAISEGVVVGGQGETDGEDLYTPSRSSWGVFPRPRDISKKFGGGRVILKAEMERLEEERELARAKEDKEKLSALSDSQKREKENTSKIQEALARARGHLYMGNRKAAVEAFESVDKLLSWQSGILFFF
jgi:hypothetical protein